MTQLKIDEVLLGKKVEEKKNNSVHVQLNSTADQELLKMYVDVHEDPVIVEKLRKEKGIFVEVRALPVGDYVFSNICIERKTLHDFYNSIVHGDKHIWKQVFNMRQAFERPILVIERWDDSFLSSPRVAATIRGAIARIILSGVTVLVIPGTGKDVQPFVDTLAYLFFASDKKTLSMRPIPEKSKQRKKKEILSDILVMIPGIGRAYADKIAENVECVEDMCRLSDEQLVKMLPRFGPKRLAVYRWIMNNRPLPKKMEGEER